MTFGYNQGLLSQTLTGHFTDCSLIHMSILGGQHKKLKVLYNKAPTCELFRHQSICSVCFFKKNPFLGFLNNSQVEEKRRDAETVVAFLILETEKWISSLLVFGLIMEQPIGKLRLLPLKLDESSLKTASMVSRG